MKVIIALALCVAAASASPIALSMAGGMTVEEEFAAWTVEFGKVYNSDDEYTHRMEVFAANKALYLEREAETGAAHGVNQFSDLTEKEFADIWLPTYVTANENPKSSPFAGLIDAPEEWNWVTEGKVVDVKSQAQCGSCWAFAASAGMESIHAIATGDLLNLSEQQLVDCDNQSHGCRGGWMKWAYEYVIAHGGMVSERDYGYTGHDGRCHDSDYDVVATFSSYDELGEDEDELKKHIYAHGPTPIAINASMMSSYRSGIIKPRSKASCNPRALNHGVTIVGYGVEEDTPYWLIKNSWGKRWGEGGYFRIIRGEGACGINTAVQSINA